jgi:hypothetical protein
MTRSSKQSGGPQTPWTAAGAMALVVLCCGGHALLLGALGGVALGSVLGIGAGVLAAVLFAAAVFGLRRRRAASCRTDVGRSPLR